MSTDRHNRHGAYAPHPAPQLRDYVQHPLTTRWCSACHCTKPRKGGQQHGGMFRCADCLPPRNDIDDRKGET